MSKKILNIILLTVTLWLCIFFTGCAPTVETPPDESGESTDSSSVSEPDVSSADSSSTSSSSAPEPPPEPVVIFEPDYDSFAAAMEKVKSDYGIVGMSAALFKGDEVIYANGWGYADRENKIPFTDATRSRVASISKMVTSMVMMTLYDQGLITPETPLSEATGLPFDVPGQEKVQLWHLMTHTAGFVDIKDFGTSMNFKYLLRNSHSGYEPGTTYIYTNFGLGAAGAVIERLTNKYFFDYADEALFRPLDMDAGYNIEMIKAKDTVAKLYDLDGSVYDVQHWRRNKKFYSSIGLGNSCYCAQCELIINAPDLARLGLLMVNDGELGGVRILSEDAVALMEKRWFSAPDYDMGLSVRIYDSIIEGRSIYGHSGNAFGAITGLYYDPETKTGIAFIANRCNPQTGEKGFYLASGDALRAAYEHVFSKERTVTEGEEV